MMLCCGCDIVWPPYLAHTTCGRHSSSIVPYVLHQPRLLTLTSPTLDQLTADVRLTLFTHRFVCSPTDSNNVRLACESPYLCRFAAKMYLLHTTPSAFIVDVDTPNPPASLLHIDRTNAIVSLVPRSSNPVPSTATSEPIHGIVGLVPLLSTSYLVTIHSASQVATLLSSPIKQITQTKLLPLSTTKPASWTAENDKDEREYLRLLNSQLAGANYYFSHELDLTLSMQRLALIKTNATSATQPFSPDRIDERFMWNHYLAQSLITAKADPYIVPVINGYVFHQSLHLASTSLSFLLISRRSTQRSGRRFITRGLDLSGYASNFAETEQILAVTSPTDRNNITLSSFLQTRGSIPLLWAQPVTLKYTPKIRVSPQANDSKLAFRRHFEVQLDKYGRQVCVNLVNQKGSELLLVKEYTALVNGWNDGRKAASAGKVDPSIGTNGENGGVSGVSIDAGELRLINWDFHHECKGMKFENVSKLIALIGKPEWDHLGYFQANVVTASINGQRRQQWSVLKQQKGVFRTNCIDCLDRTNVVQAALAQHVLYSQLSTLLPSVVSGSILPAQVTSMLRVCWANNADAMSVQYSGTGALKTDYTRTGKRTMKGALKDGVNSVTRYYLNNFQDGGHQDRVDLFLGLYQPSLSQRSPFGARRSRSHPRYERSVSEFFLRFGAAVLLVAGLYSVLVPSDHWVVKPWLHIRWWYSAVLFGVVVLGAGSRVLLRYGDRYVNKPLLRDTEPSSKDKRV